MIPNSDIICRQACTMILVPNNIPNKVKLNNTWCVVEGKCSSSPFFNLQQMTHILRRNSSKVQRPLLFSQGTGDQFYTTIYFFPTTTSLMICVNMWPKILQESFRNQKWDYCKVTQRCSGSRISPVRLKYCLNVLGLTCECLHFVQLGNYVVFVSSTLLFSQSYRV